ncbi:early nodulin-like protein 2 [Medicago truncatula]|nr:early nodulin-like protein 2 [Medicago truncatula]
MRYCFLLLVSLVILNTSLSSGYTSRVDGKEGWPVKPSSGYNVLTSGIKLLIHDNIYFKYNKEIDSVLVVNKQDHDSCNTKNPIYKMEGGDSAFQLDKSGPFYFISGNVENCQKGRKLNVVAWFPHRRLMSLAADAPSPSMVQVPAMSPTVNAPTPNVIGWNAPAPSPADIHAPSPSPTTNHAPVPSPTDNHASTPNPSGNHAPAPSATNIQVSPTPSATHKKCHRRRHWGLCFGSKCHRDSCSDIAPSPGHSGSTRLSGSVGVNVVVALVLGSLAF